MSGTDGRTDTPSYRDAGTHLQCFHLTNLDFNVPSAAKPAIGPLLSILSSSMVRVVWSTSSFMSKTRIRQLDLTRSICYTSIITEDCSLPRAEVSHFTTASSRLLHFQFRFTSIIRFRKHDRRDEAQRDVCYGEWRVQRRNFPDVLI